MTGVHILNSASRSSVISECLMRRDYFDGRRRQTLDHLHYTRSFRYFPHETIVDERYQSAYMRPANM